MKVEINVPDSLKEITLDQYQRFEKLNTEENKESTFLLQKMVEIFCSKHKIQISTRNSSTPQQDI